MARYDDSPQILRDFLSYHETIKGQSAKTIQEYYLDLRMFLRFSSLPRLRFPPLSVNKRGIKGGGLILSVCGV